MPCGVEQFYHYCIFSTAKMVKSFEMAKGKEKKRFNNKIIIDYLHNNKIIITFVMS